MKTRLLILLFIGAAAIARADTQISALPAKAAPSPADYLVIIDKAAHDSNPNGQNARQVPFSSFSGGGGGLPDQTSHANQFLGTDGTTASWGLVISSAQFAAMLSDDVGSGFFVRNNSPSFVTQITSPKNIFTTSVFDTFGTGSPEGALTANPGSTYRQTDGTAGKNFWYKDTGNGNTGWVSSVGTIEQTAGNSDFTWSGGANRVRVTVALAANHIGILPAAAGFRNGTILWYNDPVSSFTSAFTRTFQPASGELLNGVTDGTYGLAGGGTVGFYDNGSGWDVIYQRSSILGLQDPTDPTKQGQFVLSGITTGQTRQMTWPDKNFTPPDLGTTNTYTAGAKQIFSSSSSTAGAKFAGVATDPSSLAEGDVFYNSTLHRAKIYNGTTAQEVTWYGDGPVTVKIKSMTVHTSGSPQDIGTITLDGTLTRWGMFGGGTNSANKYIAETAAGTLAAASVTAFETTAGGGATLIAATNLPASAGALVTPANSLTGTSTSTTLVFRQTADSANTGTLSAYVTIFPLM